MILKQGSTLSAVFIISKGKLPHLSVNGPGIYASCNYSLQRNLVYRPIQLKGPHDWVPNYIQVNELQLQDNQEYACKPYLEGIQSSLVTGVQLY